MKFLWYNKYGKEENPYGVFTNVFIAPVCSKADTLLCTYGINKFINKLYR